ncbi:hypothetical protein [Ruminococcus sp.]|uniref:hypothetical protein n=1 Tax=Ruminococcus sp. TaxID=41978 RepID=UPI0025D8C5C4|nr:hypothetical protein [Ruminococcus sp.]MBQ8966990.1 hypothetical protein [Ruminococcus sp.]
MADNENIIDKIARHPRIWAAAALVVSLWCLISGALGLLVRNECSFEDMENAPAYSRVSGNITEVDEESSFEMRNTFCRFLPTGVEYFSIAHTKDGQLIFLRTDKNWYPDKDGKTKIKGAVKRFGKADKRDITNGLAIEVSVYADLIADRLYVLRIAGGLLIAGEVLLGAWLVKKRSGETVRGYKAATIVFCAIPFAAAALGLHLLGYA